jgi:hypothetical protein
MMVSLLVNKLAKRRKKEIHDEFNPISEKIYKNRKYLTNILEEPGPGSKAIRRMIKGATFITIDLVENSYGLWRKVFYKTHIGYIHIKIPVRPLTAEQQEFREDFKLLLPYAAQEVFFYIMYCVLSLNATINPYLYFIVAQIFIFTIIPLFFEMLEKKWR